MTTEEIYKTCKLLHATHYLPITCFKKDDTPERLFCSYAGYGTVFSAIAKKAMKGEPVSLVNGCAGLYGVIRVHQNDLLIVTGPFVNRHIDDELLDILLHDYQIAWEEREALKQFLLSLPRHSLNRFLNFLALLHYLFNGEELAITDYFRNAFPALQSEIGAKHSEEIFKEADFSHGTYGFERQLLSYVSAGDVAGIHAFFDSVAPFHPDAGRKARRRYSAPIQKHLHRFHRAGRQSGRHPRKSRHRADLSAYRPIYARMRALHFCKSGQSAPILRHHGLYAPRC